MAQSRILVKLMGVIDQEQYFWPTLIFNLLTNVNICQQQPNLFSLGHVNFTQPMSRMKCWRFWPY